MRITRFLCYFLIKNKYEEASTLYVSVTKNFSDEIINVHTERRKKIRCNFIDASR